MELNASERGSATFPATEHPRSVRIAVQQGVPDAEFCRNELLEVALATIALDHLLDYAAFIPCPVGGILLPIQISRSRNPTFLQRGCNPTQTLGPLN